MEKVGIKIDPIVASDVSGQSRPTLLYTSPFNTLIGSERLHWRASIVLAAEWCRYRDMCMIKDLAVA